MASTYSDLKIELIGTGDQSGTWGATTNTNLGTALEEAIVGRATANFTTDADLTITLSNVNTTQVARNYILNVTSGVALTATRNLIVPTIDKPYIVENNTTGSQSIVVKTSAGTGITVPTGKTVMVYANGTNVVQAFDYVPSVTVGTVNITSLTAGSITDSGLTAGRVTYAGTAGLLADSASLTFDGTTLSTTTVDATNLEVTNLKAKDGTAAGSIANSTGVVTIASSVLTTTDINGGTIDATAIGGSTPAAGAFTSGSFSTTLGVTGVATLTAQPILSSLTASSAVATDASKGLVSVTNTGTGNNVLATSPTITGATLTTAALNGTLGATTPSTVVATDLSATGTITHTSSTSANNTGFNSTTSGTFANYNIQQSTGGILQYGLDDSAGSVFGTQAYGSLWNAPTSFYVQVNGTNVTKVTSSGYTVTGDLTTTGNTILGNASTDTLNVGNGGLVKDASGNLGIGTSSPTVKLEVFNSTNPEFRLNSTSNGYLQIGQFTNGAYIGTSSSDTTFGVLKFGTATTERMHISSTGLVGIGKTPTVLLDVYNVSSAEFRVANLAHGFQLYTDDTGTTLGTYTADPLVFRTNAAERMRIDSAGNVGIGTASPATKLQVVGEIRSSTDISNSGDPVIYSYNGGTAGTVRSGIQLIGSIQEIRLLTAGTTRATIDSAGNVGIGVTPSAWASTYKAIQLGSGNAHYITSNSGVFGFTNNVYIDAVGAKYITTGSAASRQYQLNGTFVWENAPVGTADAAVTLTQAMTLDSSGNLGIGATPSGVGKFEVTSTSAVCAILRNTVISGYTSLRLYNDQNSALRALEIDYYGSTASGGELALITTTGAYPLTFGTNNTERMRIDASGNLLVGVTSSSYSSANRGVVNIGGSSGGLLSLISGTNKSYLFQSGADLLIENDNATGAMIFGTNSSTERMRIDASGNVGIGVTPSAWSAYKAIQLGTTGAIASYLNIMAVKQNTYFNGSADTYITTGAASDYYQQAGTHVWRTASSGTAGNAITFTQAMTLDASGNLLVGTTSATGKLTVAGTFSILDTASTGYQTQISSTAGLSTLNAYYATGQALAFNTTTSGGTSTERMRIDSSGNVGIGTASPNTNLTISGSTYGGLNLQSRTDAAQVSTSLFFTTSTSGNYLMRGDTGSLAFLSGAIIGSNGGTERMRIDASGNLGIGVTPSAWDSTYKASQIGAGGFVASNTGAYSAYIGNNAYYNAGWKYMATTGSSLYYNQTGNHYWMTAPSGTAGNAITFTQAMTLDSSGNLGIGTTSPDALLTLLPQTNTAYSLHFGTNDYGLTYGTKIYVQSKNPAGTTSSFHNTTKITSSVNGRADVEQYLSYVSGTASDDYQSWSTAGTQRMVLDGSGNLGIGVTPSAWSSTGKSIQIGNGSTPMSLFAYNNGIVGLNNNAYFNSGDKYATTNYASRYYQYNGSHSWETAPSGTAGNAITFTQAMTLDASGNLLVGLTATSSYLDGRINAQAVGGSPAVCAKLDPSGGAPTQFVYSAWAPFTTGNQIFHSFETETTATIRGTISYNRAGGLTVYNTTSDYRAKTINGVVENALEKVALLKPCTGRMNGASEDIDFFVAHELQEVVPSAVTGKKDATKEEAYEISPAIPAVLDEEGVEVAPAVEAVMGTRTVPEYQMVDKSAIIPLLTAAIQEQQAMISNLTARLEKLEGK